MLGRKCKKQRFRFNRDAQQPHSALRRTRLMTSVSSARSAPAGARTLTTQPRRHPTRDRRLPFLLCRSLQTEKWPQTPRTCSQTRSTAHRVGPVVAGSIEFDRQKQSLSIEICECALGETCKPTKSWNCQPRRTRARQCPVHWRKRRMK